VDSKIQNHSIAIQRIYRVDEDSDEEIATEIKLWDDLTGSLPLNVGITDLAYIKFKTDADLPLGKYEVTVACDITLPYELGGGELSPYVIYKFEVAEKPLTVWGNIIGKVENNRFLPKSGDVPIGEATLSNIESSAPWARIRDGFTADGESRLFLRIKSETPATVSLSISEMNVLGITAEDLNRGYVNLDSIALERIRDGLYQKTVVLRSPESWPDKAGKDARSYPVKIELTMDKDSPDDKVSETIELHKAPVTLIHGIWADKKSFSIGDKFKIPGLYGDEELYLPQKGLHTSLRNAGFEADGASYPNYKGPSEIVPPDAVSNDIYGKFISKAFSEMNETQNIECAKVDVVAHSMGGMMAKQFSRNVMYKNNDYSYNMGSIRRLVAIGTPHWGSPFPSYLKEDPRYLGADYFSFPIDRLDSGFSFSNPYSNYSEHNRRIIGEWVSNLNFKKFLEARLGNVGNQIGSAIDDLAICSPLIKELNALQYDFPMHVIAGDFGYRRIVFGNPVASGAADFMLGSYDHENFFGNIPRLLDDGVFQPENSDTVVGLSSALWDGAGFIDYITADTLPFIQHQGMGLNEDISDKVIDLLAGGLDNFQMPATPLNVTYKSDWVPSIWSPEDILRSLDLDIDLTPKEIKNFYANASVVSPGDPILFTANLDDGTGSISARQSPAKPESLYLIDSDMRMFEMQKAGDIFTFSYATSDDYSGEMTFQAYGSAAGDDWDEFFVSDAVKVIVKPDLSNLTWFRYTRDPRLFLSAGTEYSLDVAGLFSDGSTYNLTGSQLGTSYASSDPSVAAVSEDGTVLALSPGSATITATNSGHSAFLYLEVGETQHPSGGGETITGTNGDDNLIGTDFGDEISGGLGNDSLEGLGGNDSIYGGAGNDTLAGGGGNDRLEGGVGNDTYIYNPGDGNDTIFDNLGANILLIGEGIDPSGVKFTRSGQNFLNGVFIMPDGGSITVEHWFNSLGTYKLSEIRFADGTVWTKNYVDSLSTLFEGTEGDDVISGSPGGDIIYGYGGNDTMHGQAGDDILIGGPGADFLQGWTGDDVYIWNPGDGSDTIYSQFGGGDVLEIGGGIDPAGLSFSRSGNNLEIHLNDEAGAMLTIQAWHVSDLYKLSGIRFADGTAWTQSDISDIASGTKAPFSTASRNQSGGQKNVAGAPNGSGCNARMSAMLLLPLAALALRRRKR
jgi:Ca2+-binding RTX toxin-like protein/pimeloyl-ACP methyl ester carboxylesterase